MDELNSINSLCFSCFTVTEFSYQYWVFFMDFWETKFSTTDIYTVNCRVLCHMFDAPSYPSIRAMFSCLYFWWMSPLFFKTFKMLLTIHTSSFYTFSYVKVNLVGSLMTLLKPFILDLNHRFFGQFPIPLLYVVVKLSSHLWLYFICSGPITSMVWSQTMVYGKGTDWKLYICFKIMVLYLYCWISFSLFSFFKSFSRFFSKNANELGT